MNQSQKFNLSNGYWQAKKVDYGKELVYRVFLE